MKKITQLFKICLLPFAWLYDAITSIRNWAFDHQYLSETSFNIPIINVGNLAVGGTGKTPHVEYITQLLHKKYKTATLSRGYKRKTKGLVFADQHANAYTIGDEPMQYYYKFSDVTVAVCEKRVDGINGILNKDKATNIIICDDAYQHRYIKPDINILLTDYKKTYAHDYLMPYGRLRENKHGAKRAHIIVVTKCPKDISLAERERITKALHPLPNQEVYFSYIAYSPIYDFMKIDTKASIQDKNILLITGIANNESIIQHLKLENKAVKVLQYPDHHYFTTSELAEMKRTYDAWVMNNKVIVTTEKDIVRLALHYPLISNWKIPIYVLPIEIDFIADKTTFNQSILNQVDRKIYGQSAT